MSLLAGSPHLDLDFCDQLIRFNKLFAIGIFSVFSRTRFTSEHSTISLEAFSKTVRIFITYSKNKLDGNAALLLIRLVSQ